MTSAVDRLFKNHQELVTQGHHLRLALIDIAYPEPGATVTSLRIIACDALADDKIACEILDDENRTCSPNS